LRDNGTRSIIRFSTFTYSSFNWIYELFYINGIKVVPKCIEDYLTPLALAIWIMDDGGPAPKRGLIIATNSFNFEDVTFLASKLGAGLHVNMV
jgi:hypothetical protein